MFQSPEKNCGPGRILLFRYRFVRSGFDLELEQWDKVRSGRKIDLEFGHGVALVEVVLNISALQIRFWWN